MLACLAAAAASLVSSAFCFAASTSSATVLARADTSGGGPSAETGASRLSKRTNHASRGGASSAAVSSRTCANAASFHELDADRAVVRGVALRWVISDNNWSWAFGKTHSASHKDATAHKYPSHRQAEPIHKTC
eukprot:1179636-Prorocentrum_minimum.AAC.2